MAKRPKQQTVESLLRDLEKRERATGLLGLVEGKASGGGLLSAPPKPQDFTDAAVPNGPGYQNKVGLLSPQRGGPSAPSPVARAGSFLDDLFFGGAAGERAAERRQRAEQRAMSGAHRDAFASATRGGRFDPQAYAVRMGELGQAPAISDLVNLEGVTDSQDLRGQRQRTERREVQAGAFAPIAGLPGEQQAGPLGSVLEYLKSQGMDYSGPIDPSAVQAAVGAGMGANGFLDNQRGDRALGENIRSNQAAEDYRNQDLGFRREESIHDRVFREKQFSADDAYRNSRAAAEDAYRAWEQQNSVTRSDIEGQVLRKAITNGQEALTPEERAVYDRAVAITGQGGFGMGGGYVPGVGGAPAPAQSPVNPRPQGEGQGQGGNGSSPQAPARPMDEASFESLPMGAWFINPADGQVMQKVR